MHVAMLCLATAVLGIDVGWQPLPSGGMEYIIQIGPQTLDVLKSGELIQSDVPAEVRDIRAYRIVVGTGRLPRELPAAPQGNLPDPLFPPQRTPTTEPHRPGAPPVVPAEGPQQTGSPAAPRTLPPEPAGKPLSAEKATFVEPSGAPQQAAPKPAEAQPQEESPRPWLVLMLVALGLFASLGGNVYLGWITWDVHRRYRALLRQFGQPAA